MNRIQYSFFYLFNALALVGLFSRPVLAEPAPEAIRQTIRDYISMEESAKGSFRVMDSTSGKERVLELERVHERVGKTGDYYYSCADLKDTQNGDILDLDFDVSDADGKLSVVDVRIHKDNGNSRYTYDENDNMIPVAVSQGV